MKLFLSLLLLTLPVTTFAADSFFGVGIMLEQTEEKFFVDQLIPGGPAEKSGMIQAGDEIVAVQTIEGRDLPWVPVANMQIEDVVGMIRGEEGTRVGLHMVNAATGQYEVFMTREEIKVEE